jgi:hypothetical protein
MPKPIVAPAGAGLPPIEAFMSRYIIFPLVSRVFPIEKAAPLLVQTGKTILQQFDALSSIQQQTPVLIPRLMGLEDSSRNWSPQMVIEHLLITSDGMLILATQLANNQQPETIVSTATVKPQETTPSTCVENYRTWLNTYETEVSSLLTLPVHAVTTRTHPHPWFGELTARQWLVLNTMHHLLHQRQFNKILNQ